MLKSKLKKIAAAALAAAGLTALSIGASGCLPKSTDLTEPENIEIAKFAPPDDGSLPTAHTCAENLAYINYVFDNQTQYHTYSYGVTSASIATQTTRNFRDYKDGILMNTDLTYSSMVRSGTQTCSMYNDKGEYEVYFRTSAAPEADTLPAQAEWSQEAPTFFNERSYHYTYGLLPNELFNYIVNEQNIIDSEQIKVNSDGTYTQNFTLDPVASTYFYQFGMKTRGGLSGYPEFESITFSVTFDGDWQILSAVMHEVAKVNKGIIVSSVSDFTTEYSYGGERFDGEHFAYYENYFKKYVGGGEQLEQGGGSNDNKPTVDITNVLSNGFSQIMNGGAQFEITIDLGANRYTGYAFVSLDLADPLETLALKVSLGKSLREQALYIEYGNGEMAAYYGKDFALTGNLAEVKLAVGEFGEIIDKITAAFAKGDGGETTAPEAPADTEVKAEASDPLSELMNAMVLTAGEKQAVLTLDTDDLLGLGIGINAKLVFGINNNKITFRSGSVGGLSIGGETVDLGINILTTTAPEINRVPSETSADLAEYIADIHSLLGADIIKVTANLNGDGEKVSVNALKGLVANVTAFADLEGVTVGAQADVAYTYNGQKVSAKAEVWYGYDPKANNYGAAVVALTEFNGRKTDLKIKCDIKEVADAVITLVTFAGGDGGAATDGLVGIINNALSSDFSSLLTELYADKMQIKAGVSVDALLDMLGVNAGLKFGSCTLKYRRGEGVYGGELSAALPALGLDIAVCGESGALGEPDTENCLDLMYVIEDIKEIATADLLKAHISLDGSAEGVAVSQLKGLTAGVDVYFNLENIAVAADIDLGYTYGKDTVNAKLSAWYDKGAEGLGKIVLSLTQINGAPLAAKVYCDITEIKDAVTALLNLADIKLTPFENTDNGSLQTADIITKILGADFNALLPVLNTTDDGLNIAVNADEVLAIFGVNTEISLGNVSLAYSHSADKKLVAAAPALGLGVDISGAAGEIKQMPDPADCLDLTDLVNTVTAAWEQVNGIIEGQSVAFEIVKGETFLLLDGITVEIWGDGEVCWKAGGEYVALDLAMSICNGANNADVTELRFVYDKNAGTTPLVKLALNNVGIEIYKDDIEGVKSGFADIYNKVTAMLGKESGETQPSQPADGKQNPLGALSASENLTGVLFGILASDGWVDFLNDFTVTCDGKSVALRYLSDNAVNVSIGADGNLSLFYDGAFGERFTLGGGIVVSPVLENLCDVIDREIEAANIIMSSSKTEGSAGFVKLAYDYLFEAISSVSVKNILGSDTYTVKFKLNGNNTNIPELENIFVNAEIYVTGESADEGKLAEATLNIDAAGVIVDLNVITERKQNNTYFYINLAQVADIKLPDLKFVATQQSLYETFDVLISTLNNTNILDAIGKLAGVNGSGGETDTTAPEQGGENAPVITEETADKLANIITRILNFNFSQAVVATETDGVTTAVIDLDNIVKQFGIETGALGTVEAVINHNNHSMKTSGKTLITDLDGKTELKEWISLSSEVAERRDYSAFERADYISIEFLPALIDDIVKTATDQNGDMYGEFTLSGTVDVNLVSIITVKIENATLTVSMDDGFYFSFVGYLTGSSLITKGVIGVSYQNGYLTLGRKLNSSGPEYRVMTFDYFIDNMFAKGETSTLNWLIGANNTIWNMVVSGLGDIVKDINSGLTTPEDIYLYKANSGSEETEISMYDYINALRVIINGNQTALIGDYSTLESELGVSDNYYGVDLNAGLMTGGVLTKLYAAIVRDDDTGISGVKAYGAIDSYVTFKASLGYAEGLTSDNRFIIGSDLTAGLSAPCLNVAAIEKAAAANVTIDFDHYVKKPESGYDEIFGCFNTADMSYDYSHKLYSHTLTIVKTDGEREERAVRHGSVVHLYDNNSPVYTYNGKTVRVLYSASPDAVGDKEVIMDGDLTVYELRRAAVTVVVHSGAEEYTVNMFEGCKVPTVVDGLETVAAPTYDEAGMQSVGANDIIDGSSSVIHIYGTFVKSEIVVNYVKYTFDAQTMSYAASGKAAGFNDAYSAKGNTLVLESYIGGYPVTAVADGAFANTEGKPIKNVIIPATVTSIGSGAFLDNNGLESVIILGEYVKVGGNSEKDNNKNNDQPFYGCSTETDGTSTNLVIYYNTIECGGSTDSTIWTKFRVSGSAIKYRYYIGQKPSNENSYAKNGGGALRPAGSWCMLGVEISGADIVEDTDFNALVNSFVTGGLKVDGVYTKADAEALAAKLTSELSQYKNAAGGDKYVVNINLTSNSSSDLKLSVKVLLNVPKQITVYSEVAMTYGGAPVDGGKQTNVYATKSGDGVALVVPVAKDGSVFLGWAVEKGGKLEFVGEQVEAGEGTVFYAVWGKSKVGAEVRASINYSGTALSMPATGNNKWYDNDWNEVTEISKENTVVYMRSVYTFSYKLSGNFKMKVTDTLHNVSENTTKSYSASFEVLEAQNVTAVKEGGKTVKIYVDGNLKTTLTLTKYLAYNYDFKDFTFNETVNDNLSLDLKW